jgi:nicotinate-nucleotide adenylyltransferase
MGVTVLYGGAFDPPHVGHIAVADAARKYFGVERLVILVSERPAHRKTHASPEDRRALACAAFPHDDVRLDRHPRTIELLRSDRFENPVFVIGADQFAGFLDWAEPDEVLERATLAVATRPGYPREKLDAVLAKLAHPEKVVFLEIEPNPAASRDIRAGSAPEDVTPEVAELIEHRWLYRP